MHIITVKTVFSLHNTKLRLLILCIHTSGDDQWSDDSGQRERTTTAEATAEMEHCQQQSRQQYHVTERVQSLRRLMPIYTVSTTTTAAQKLM